MVCAKTGLVFINNFVFIQKCNQLAIDSFFKDLTYIRYYGNWSIITAVCFIIDLNISVTRAVFQSSGNMPVFKDKLDIFFKEFNIVLPAACMSLTEILSIPADLQVFILDITTLIIIFITLFWGKEVTLLSQ